MKTKTPRTTAAEQKAERCLNHVGAIKILTSLAAQLETELHEYRQVSNHMALALSNLNNDASNEISEYQEPQQVKDALTEYAELAGRGAAMPDICS
jgi:cytochrome c553